MALIRPCAELRNNYSEISKICHETKKPIYITKNGVNDLVILSNEAYEKMEEITKETEEERVDRLVAEHFEEYYDDFTEFKNDIFEVLHEAINEIEEGNGIDMEDVLAEMEVKYHLN